MSDIGLVSYQYQVMAELARQLRHNLLQIKREHYGLPQPENVVTDTVFAISEFYRIVEFLYEVIELPDGEIWPEKWIEHAPLPNATVEQLRHFHTLDMPRYHIWLENLQQRLSQGISSLRDKDIQLLEEIVRAANTNANTVFRRLMRWA